MNEEKIMQHCLKKAKEASAKNGTSLCYEFTLALQTPVYKAYKNKDIQLNGEKIRSFTHFKKVIAKTCENTAVVEAFNKLKVKLEEQLQHPRVNLIYVE